MNLNNRQRRQLKGLAHHLKPVVTIGNKGLSEQVKSEIDSALAHHELIKVKLPAIPKDQKQTLIDEISSHGNSVSIGLTGRVVIFFKPNADRKNPIALVS